MNVKLSRYLSLLKNTDEDNNRRKYDYGIKK